MIENPYIVTFTGKKVHPLNATPDELCIEDIAHALAYKCRWSGHTTRFHSIAQHSVIVANLFTLQPLWGLLHDASEAYLADVPSLIKPHLPTLKYAEDQLMEVIQKKFKLPNLDRHEEMVLKRADWASMKHEWETMVYNPEGHDIGIDLRDVPEIHVPAAKTSWMPVEAERVFLKVYRELVK